LLVNETQARQIAADYLTQLSEEYRSGDWVQTDAEEYATAWVVAYQTRAFMETGRLSDRLAGNGPVVVPKSGGEPWMAWSGLPVADQLARGRPGLE
jgi:hypothetical protein